jgi:hypothetical protein
MQPPAAQHSANGRYVAVHIAFSKTMRLCCLGIHQVRARVAWNRLNDPDIRDDSAGKKGGLPLGSAFFHLKSTIDQRQDTALSPAS